MLAHHRRALIIVASVTLGFFGLVASCSRVPLLAPTGTVINLIPEASSASLNSQITIIATLIENGVAPSASGNANGSGGSTSSVGGGTPVHNGTHVTFTTTLGTIQPSDAITTNGTTQVTLVTGGQSGTAHITAYSGGASKTLDIPVGAAAVRGITITAAPQTLGVNGGASNIVANVTDAGGSVLGGVPVSFTTDQGTLTPSTVQTDANGNATTVLSTTATAKVTASAGTGPDTGGGSGSIGTGTAPSATVTITVSARGLSGFTNTATSATAAGTPVQFTVTPTTGANISNVHVDFGDGSGIDLGAIGTATTVFHAYSAPGIYTATATATSAGGSTSSLATQVIIGSLQVTLSAVPNPTIVGTPVTFVVSGTTGAAVDHYQWSWDDGTPSFATSGAQTTHTFTSPGPKTVRVDVIGVSGGLLGSVQMSIQVQ